MLGKGTKEKEKPRNLEAFKTWIFRRPYRAPPKKILYFELPPPWHPYVLLLAYLLAFYLAYLLAFYLAYLMAFYLAFYLVNLLAYVRANILAHYLIYLLAFYLAYLLAFYRANILALYLAYLLAFFLTFYLAFYLAYLLAFYLAVEAQRCSPSSESPRLRSSGAHWARKVPGWGPAVLTELGRSQVEVQLCSLSSEVGEELARRKWTDAEMVEEAEEAAEEEDS